ncbi:MAG: hypothetical protein JXR25_07465 [Pontiellaceae bacterium]|nr:hypothetical protein [Pontiellaceae bacterium]MBN2784650.1 hypothetical protein [Pontiellaceae bacterium]
MNGGPPIRKSPVILYGVLLLLSAAIIAGVAARLLSREQARLDSSVRETEELRLQNRAEQLELAVSAVQDGLMRSLESIPASALRDTLREMERTNPLVRNVFVWRGANDLLLPNDSEPLTKEEQGFLIRYSTLFDGTHGWDEVVQEDEYAAPVSRRLFSRSRGWNPPMHSGWIPWYWENRLGMIGWMERDGLRYGVELEMAMLLCELQQAMPLDIVDGRMILLLDGSGRRIMQSGSIAETSGTSAVLSVPVGPALPHWELALHTTDGALGPAAQRYALLSGLLVFILFIVLFSAGGLLLRETVRNRLEAQQKTTFVSNVSHELKTPLTTIRMYAELLGEGRVSDIEKRGRYLKTIASESERLSRLVNNVLDFSRLEQNRKQYRISHFDLCEVVSETVASQRIRIGEAGMELSVVLPNVTAMVKSDRDAVQQVLLNLIDNAVKYAAAGGRLTIELAEASGGFRIAVADAGPGIAKEHRRKIYERFYRIDDSITASSQGSGLGLSLSRRLITDLGGALEYHEAECGGACFVMTVPGVENR